MKKTIVIIILAVYVASIAVVNFFGLEVRQFDSITYVTSSQCDSVIFHGDNSRKLEPTQFAGKDGNTPVFVFDFIPAKEGEPYTLENITDNPNIIQIQYEVMPHLASETDVKFEYDEDAGVAIFHELSGSFIFLKSDVSITITIKATDGSNVSTQLRIKGRSVNASGIDD